MCRQLGVGVTAYGVLSRGLLSGHWSKDRVVTAADFRAHSPRFVGENLDHNLQLVATLGDIATQMGVTIAQLAIAWILGDTIVPLVGARRRDRLDESLGAVDLELTNADLSRIEQAIPRGAAAGDRYDPRLMATLDSERRRV